uniref:2-dehydropantoate 2-reductase n=1 Tax=Mucochytrium quahogii TaxID=96639 RepID=A0A7S2R6Q3_9STRA|mmetsp:Transcript_10681/g.17445  ORF Transcript_10681/g.17445 Transcript_10681/m.17445 type:complete len:352 (+) Transcript_10681:252-1307(+)|eukprot:CAMPEP_0203757704 /NCGR_PEP_ID=MMETSP0098-20131031/10644_1 /ASSEMBLY_ACC=CAM_ASM_000208 /TAXON_ID=96639 /ORGANISM=" , Strain NY0313808BC1" /LENGTH=351 /DNA_ID=CAMNT_0050649933 /DNA_START=220 /DNA_END=1275 /DNA_ORIENTATION=-
MERIGNIRGHLCSGQGDEWPRTFCIVGAGAIGGMVGAKLALDGGYDVTLVARGAHYAAMKKRGGVSLIEAGKERFCSSVAVADDIETLGGKFDVVILAVKSHQIQPVAHMIEGLCRDDRAVVVPLQNGIPWWYFYKEGGVLDGTCLKTCDPNGILHQYIRLDRIIGCIAFPAATLPRPGVIQHVEGRAFPLGEPDRSISGRAKLLSAAFSRSGFKSPVLEKFRDEIWLKLLGNICFNPISALTGSTVSELASFGPTKTLCIDVMKEAEQVATNLGCKIRVGIDYRLKRAEENVGSHKTSMLQDRILNKPIETDIIVSVVEIADLLKCEIPSIKSLSACTLLLNKVLISGSL